MPTGSGPELQALRRSQSLELEIDLLRVVFEPNQQAGDDEHIAQESREMETGTDG